MILSLVIALACQDGPEACNGRDDDADGRVDEGMLRFHSESGLGDGYIGGLLVAAGVGELVETDQDGVVTTHRYDADGNRVETAYEDTKTYVYEDGDLVLEEWDEHGDGTIDGRKVWSYDERHHRVSGTTYKDGEEHSRYEWVWDEDLELESTIWNAPEDRVQSHTENTYDAAGNRVVQEIDTDGDGVFDWRTTSTYDPLGRALAGELDEDGDGVTDRGWTKAWVGDAPGVFHDNVHTADEDADGTPDSQSTWDHLADGQLLSVEEDHGLDGDIDFHWLVEHDDDGNVQWAEVGYDHPENGYTNTTTLDYEQGNLIRRAWSEVDATAGTSSGATDYRFECH